MDAVLVVLPTYNEAANIEEVLRRTRRALPEASVLVVDDGSPDGTADRAEALAGELGSIDVMRRFRPTGLGDAYRAGFAWGLERNVAVLVEMDSDLSHDPAALPLLVGALADADLAIGSRYVPGGSVPRWAWYRRLLSRGGNLYSAVLLGVPVRDMTSGFRAYRAEVVQALGLEQVRAEGYGFQIEMTYRAAQVGARICEVPIRFVEREHGESKMSSGIVVEALWLVSRWGLRRMLASFRRRAALVATPGPRRRGPGGGPDGHVSSSELGAPTRWTRRQAADNEAAPRSPNASRRAARASLLALRAGGSSGGPRGVTPGAPGGAGTDS
jgi:dolichol-phosphate mannosyltransferase